MVQASKETVAAPVAKAYSIVSTACSMPSFSVRKII
jgi:hypothetical protein